MVPVLTRPQSSQRWHDEHRNLLGHPRTDLGYCGQPVFKAGTMKRPIRLLVSREHAEQILSWYDQLPAAINNNEDTALAASIERAIEDYDEGMWRKAAKRQNGTDPALTTAERHVRVLFGGKR